MFIAACVHCGQQHRADESVHGKQVLCAKCERRFFVWADIQGWRSVVAEVTERYGNYDDFKDHEKQP